MALAPKLWCSSIVPRCSLTNLESDDSVCPLSPRRISRNSSLRIVRKWILTISSLKSYSSDSFLCRRSGLSRVSSTRIFRKAGVTRRINCSTFHRPDCPLLSSPREVSRNSRVRTDSGAVTSTVPCADDERASTVWADAGPHVVGRRTMLDLCICLGLLSAGMPQDEAAALLGDVPPQVGLENGRLRSCEGAAPCVSTSAFRSPSRFMPPWQYLGSQADAYGALLKALKRMGAQTMKTDDGRYIYATISTSTSKEDIDDLEFLFVGKVVCFRSLSRRIALDPPFCWWPGCINGPSNRGRMEALRDDLGWIPLETDEDKAWTPIFLH